MITLVDDQDVPGFPLLAVIKGGDYQNGDLVLVYNKGDPLKNPQFQFEAQFISIGESIYQ